MAVFNKLEMANPREMIKFFNFCQQVDAVYTQSDDPDDSSEEILSEEDER